MRCAVCHCVKSFCGLRHISCWCYHVIAVASLQFDWLWTTLSLKKLSIREQYYAVAHFMYQPVPSLTIPLGDPRGFVCSHCRGVGFSANFLCLGVGASIRQIFDSFKRKMQEFLDLFQRNWKQFENQVFLCYFNSIFAKALDVYCIFNKIYHFRAFRSLPGHPRVTLLMLDHH